MNKYIRIFNTVKYLKPKQICFRLFYFVRNSYRKKVGFKYPTFENIQTNKLFLIDSINSYKSYYSNNNFTFLNLSKKFENKIDWNYCENGKLWTYNITYFDFLNQKEINAKSALSLIHNFINEEDNLKDAIEPFPISLRGINWIKFLNRQSIEDNNINTILYKHYNILMDNLEYHLLGNHLLENGFSLLFGAYYFKDEKFYNKAKEILEEELAEQILLDGAHFELTPMYHQIMLFRVLDCINLVKNNKYKNGELLNLLTEKASLMLGWLKNITYKNGDIPLLNDSAKNIAPNSKESFVYAQRLDLEVNDISLKESGYRKIVNENYECVIDIGRIGPDYIPGHAHSDTFNFELYIDNKPFIVDTGLSTYETNERRMLERSTSSHNTVEVNKTNQSAVWAGFRVANRAKIIDTKETNSCIEATHDGYKDIGILHTRKWTFNNRKVIVEDKLNKECNAIAKLHFHPDITKEEVLSHISVNEDFKFIEYTYSPAFNTQLKAIAIEIKFDQNCKVEVNI